MAEKTFTCDDCGRSLPRDQMKEVVVPDNGGERRLELCPEDLDKRMGQAEQVYGVEGEEKRRAAYLAQEKGDRPNEPVTGRRETGLPSGSVGPTGGRPATMTSSAEEARPEQAATAPKEGSMLTEPERPASSLPDAERSVETDSSRAEAQPAPGLDDDISAEQQRPGAAPGTIEERDRSES